MPSIIDCPSCHRKLRVPDDLFGQQVKCPTCSTIFTAAREIIEPASPRVPHEPPPTTSYEEEQPGASTPAAVPPKDYVSELPHYYGEDRGPRGVRRRRDYTAHRGTLILVLGILSIVVCHLLGPVAWVMGNNDMAQIRAGRMDPEGEGTTQAGRICGIIGTCIIVLYCLLWCGMFGMMGVGGGGNFRGAIK